LKSIRIQAVLFSFSLELKLLVKFRTANQT